MPFDWHPDRTAARFSDLDEVIVRLFGEKELAILKADGTERLRSLKRLHPTDLISLPATPLLPSMSRVRRR